MRGLSRQRVLVTGGAGFLGSQLCRLLLARGHEVLCVDNFYSSTKDGIAQLLDHPRFELLRHDVTFPLYVEVDQIYNLACPASPIYYQQDPVQTTKTSVHGAINLLGLQNQPITLYGDGSQTRSFCFVSDLVTALELMMETPAEITGPFNLGNPVEVSIRQLAETIIELTGSRSQVIAGPLPSDDPSQRCPDISQARAHLGWSPQVAMDEGLKLTISYFDDILATGSQA